MAEAVGVSRLYPAVPIMNFLAMVLLLLVVPSFWKTRIVALVSLPCWVFLANLLYFTGTIYWRGHTNDAPVFASIFTVLARAQGCGFATSLACFAHFTWQRLHPNCVCKLYDTRRRNNMIYFFFTLILPLLWVPLFLLSSPARYTIIEDVGPMHYIRPDWLGLLLFFLPLFLGYMTAGMFNFLTLVNYWRMTQKGIDSDILKLQSPVQTRKLLLMAAINMLFAIHALRISIISLTGVEWSTPTSIAENISSLQIVLANARSDLSADCTTGIMRGAIITPLLAFYHFSWFGLGAEARKAYVEALLKLELPISTTLRAHLPQLSTPTFSWSATTPLRDKFRQGLANALSFVLPNRPQIMPYTSSVPPDDIPHLPTSHGGIIHSYSAGNRGDIKLQGTVPSRGPAGRLSIHKPALAALNPANAIQSVLNVPLPQFSHHKSPFVPRNGPLIASPNASGSSPPSVEGANNIKRQERFAPRPHSRRLSYHKSAFVPLAPANANGAAPNTRAPTIPLVEIPRDTIGERNATLRSDDVVEDRMAPPPFSTISIAPPPFPTPSTAIPAPPYRDVNPFLNDAY